MESITPGHRIFEHSPGDGRHPGKLVLIFLGNFQPRGDEHAGLYKFAKTESENEGYEVITFRVGNLYQMVNEVAAPDSFHLHPDVVFTETRNTIMDRMQGRGAFAGLQPVTEVASESYSWGGGTHDLLFGKQDASEELLGSAKLKAAAYIDAVSLKWGGPISQRPAAEHFWNVYQEHDYKVHLLELMENAIPFVDVDVIRVVRGAEIAGTENEQQNYGLTVDHENIDEIMVNLLWEHISEQLE